MLSLRCTSFLFWQEPEKQGLPPEQIMDHGMLSISLIALIVEVKGEVAVEVQIPGINELGPCLSNDNWENVAAITSGC